MRQLFQNLIGNALKYHKPDVSSVVQVQSQLVHIQADASGNSSAAPEHCRISVVDNGIGFDEKYSDRIFQVFQRLHNRAEYEGSGMGLAICRKIADRHNGDIVTRSTPGVGSTFIVTLPVKQPKGDKTA
jgi:two-component system, NtrC family, sensor kinase